MQEKKAADILVMDLRNVPNSVADYFVICSGNSDTQIEAISDSVEGVTLKEGFERPYHIEGKKNLEWVLLDYINVVVHIFKKDKRTFYGLENLWGDAVALEIVA
jgi:ribosome-associated protein